MIEFEEQLLNCIDARIEDASDDELFAGGYLRGHISLSAASCEEDGINDVQELKQRITQSIEQARNELNPNDQVIVRELWETLQTEVAA